MISSKKKKFSICIVGPGKNFLSGITYYTYYLANSFAEKYKVSVIFLRELVPRKMFPGKKRLGQNLTQLQLEKGIRFFDGVDWHLFPGIFRLPSFFRTVTPDIMIFQWWTAAVAHSYLLMSLFVRIFHPKTKLILVFHEVQDPLEQSFFLLRIYAKLIGRLLFRTFHAYAVHSEVDRCEIERSFGLPRDQVYVVIHGSYNSFKGKSGKKPKPKDDRVCTLLFWGLIRPYKGVPNLIRAFDLISERDISRFRLIIAGEPWDKGETENAIKKCRYKDRIKFIQRYLSDEEVDMLFHTADVAVFPYIRASQSGAALTAVSYGLPIIVSKVGGLKESLVRYDGTIFVTPGDVRELKNAILESYSLRTKRFKDPFTWQESVSSYEKIFAKTL